MNMKKLTSLFTAGAIALSLAACNDKGAKLLKLKHQKMTQYIFILGLNMSRMVC